MDNPITYFAKTDFRGQNKTFGIKKDDRRLHMYILGKTGAGKSTLLKNLIIQNFRNGNGVGVIDPHGDLVESLLDFIPSYRTNDVVYFNPADRDYPIGFNILESVRERFKPLVTSCVISVFKNIWKDFWGPRLEYILYNSVISLLDDESSTLLGVPRILTDQRYRNKVVSQVKDPIVNQFWRQEYEGYKLDFQKEAISPVQNKVGQFLTSPVIRNIVGQVKSKIDMGFMMDNQRILLCNLAKGKIGEDTASLLGSLIVTKIYLAALQRVDQPEEERKDFYLYIDECHNLATPIFASILSEARKYRLNLILTHQYLDQLTPEIKSSVLGNVGTLICFRLGSQDAEELQSEFLSEFTSTDLEKLEKYQIYLKLAIDSLPSKPFSAKTLPPIMPAKNENNRKNIIKNSRRKHATKRKVIENKIEKWCNN